MSIDYKALKTELEQDPLARGYAGMDRAQKAASLNVKDRENPRLNTTPIWDIQTTIPASQQIAWKDSADTTAQLYYTRFQQALEANLIVDADAPPITTWFNYLRGMGTPPITAGTRNDIRALGKVLVSRAVELKISLGDDITEGMIAHVETRL